MLIGCVRIYCLLKILIQIQISGSICPQYVACFYANLYRNRKDDSDMGLKPSRTYWMGISNCMC